MVNSSIANEFGITNENINKTMKTINKVIIKNAWKPLGEVYNSDIKIVGNSALNWDAQVLLDEQAKVQKFYTYSLTETSKKQLNKNAHNTFFGKYVGRPMMTKKQSVLVTKDRWQYGMTLMGISIDIKFAPKEGGDWKKGKLKYIK